MIGEYQVACSRGDATAANLLAVFTTLNLPVLDKVYVNKPL